MALLHNTYGIAARNFTAYPEMPDARALVDYGVRMEQMGFDSLWVWDHILLGVEPNFPIIDSLTLLTAIAARTSRIKLSTGILVLPLRNPVVLAKQLASIDQISNGRLLMAMAAGWYKREFDAVGVPFEQRGKIMDENLDILKRFWTEDMVKGEWPHHKIPAGVMYPKPVQKPRPPLVLGAFGPRMLKIVATYADTWNAFGTPKEMRERNQMLDDYCREIGRDPDTLDRSLYYWVPTTDADPWASKQAFYEVINPYIEAGVNQFILDQPRDDQLNMLEWVAAEVLPQFAGEVPHTVETAAAGQIDTSAWKRPQDHL